MNRSKRGAPGTVVSPAEIDDLIRRVRDLRTHITTNARHLATIEKRLTFVEAELDALADPDVGIATVKDESIPSAEAEWDQDEKDEEPEEEKA